MCKDFTSLGMFQEIIIARIDELVSTNIDNFNLLNIFNERNYSLFYPLIFMSQRL